MDALPIPGLPKALNSGIVLKSYRGPDYKLRYVPKALGRYHVSILWQLKLSSLTATQTTIYLNLTISISPLKEPFKGSLGFPI